jgi:hypothetical protein
VSDSDRTPLPPEVLAGALQDRVHKDAGPVRAAKSVRHPAEPVLPDAERMSNTWACRACGFGGEGFSTVEHAAGDYDVACPRCGSHETDEWRQALSSAVNDRDDAELRASETEQELEQARRSEAALRERVRVLEEALPKCRDCDKPATRRIDGKWYCDEWGEADDDMPTAAAVRAAIARAEGRGES